MGQPFLNELMILHIHKETLDEDWENVKACCPNLTEWGLKLLKKGLKDAVKTVVIEPYYMCKDYRNLYSNYYSKKFIEPTSNTNRLHFFSSMNISNPEFLLDSEKFQQYYLGYSVIRPIKDRCIGRTVIDLKKVSTKNDEKTYYLETQFSAHIHGIKYTVNGYSYTAQTADVHVCAHAALWGACRFLSERYTVYGELYPFDFVRLTDLSRGRSFPYRGMTYADYAKIFSDFGTYPVILRLKSGNQKDEIDLNRFLDLCVYVESGFPVLSSYGTHVVSIIGHTLDFNQALDSKETEFIDSPKFFNRFVVVDDNCFPYQFLGFKGDKKNYSRGYSTEYSIENLVTAVCPLPEKVFLQADKARELFEANLKHFLHDITKLNSPPYIKRLFLTTNSSFKKRKIDYFKQNDQDSLLFHISTIRLPHFIWILEISPFEKYIESLCYAEFVIDPTASSYENPLIYARIGDTLYFSMGKEKKKQFASNPKFFPQYTHNLGERNG